jgi:hypothetical protein
MFSSSSVFLKVSIGGYWGDRSVVLTRLCLYNSPVLVFYLDKVRITTSNSGVNQKFSA